MSRSYERELGVAIAAVAQAAELCRAVRAGVAPQSLSKADKSPVTVADFGSQALVCRALRGAFPADPIIAEEDAAAFAQPENAALAQQVVEHVSQLCGGAAVEEVSRWIDEGGAGDYCERFWTLDPIDGTKGFLRNEQYAVALSLIVDGQPVVGALACPNLDGGAIFSAVRGQSACQGSSRIRVSATSDPGAAQFCESVESGHSSHGEAAAVAAALRITAAPVRMDSQCKYAVVARGGADIYLRLPTRGGYVERIWDHAAGALIVTEAGGKVTDITGKPLEFHHGRGLDANRGVVATNGVLHEQVLAALAQIRGSSV